MKDVTIKVRDVKHLGGHRLALAFSDGSHGEVDLSSHLGHSTMEPLRDEKVFATAHVDRGTVSWDEGVDFAPEFLFALAHDLPPPESLEQARENERTVSLRELRRLAGLTQVEVAAAMGIAQGEVSRLEHRADFHLSTLRRYVQALGGDVEVVARIGDKSIMLRWV